MYILKLVMLRTKSSIMYIPFSSQCMHCILLLTVETEEKKEQIDKNYSGGCVLLYVPHLF